MTVFVIPNRVLKAIFLTAIALWSFCYGAGSIKAAIWFAGIAMGVSLVGCYGSYARGAKQTREKATR